METKLRAWLELDKDALVNNLAQVRQCSDAQVMPVIKANAYGHGLAFAAKVLQYGADAFAVATLDEALSLRALCPDKLITVLSGFFDPSQIEIFSIKKLQPVVFNLSQIQWLQASASVPDSVWLKIDTGMGRLGIEAQHVDSAVQSLQTLGCEVGLMSHFASADTPDSKQNEAQHYSFKRLAAAYSLSASFANSAAILSRPQDHYDLVRPGIMLYGSSPFSERSAAELGLQPVMALYARLIDIKNLKAGDSVGYGASWVATQDSTIGIVSIGYGDGYPRVVNQDAQIAIGNRRYSLLGRVSMDSFAVLLEAGNEHGIGTQVELWGKQISIDEVARWANTIAYELLCKLTSRVTRVEI